MDLPRMKIERRPEKEVLEEEMQYHTECLIEIKKRLQQIELEKKKLVKKVRRSQK